MTTNVSPSNSDTSPTVHDSRSIVAVIVPMAFGLIFVLSVVGNGLVVFVTAVDSRVRTTTTDVLIVNLAVVDLLFAVFCVPFIAADYVLENWIFGDTWCRIVEYIGYVTGCVSVYILVLVCLDRYLAVMHPTRSVSIRTAKREWYVVGIVWIVTLVSSIPMLFIHGEYKSLNEPCATEPTSLPKQLNCGLLPDVDRPLFHVTYFMCCYIAPLTIIYSLYFLMLRRLWVGTRASCQEGRTKTIKLVFVVIGVFALCWLPIHVILVLRTLGMYEMTTLNVKLLIGAQVLDYMNNCINPVLNAFQNENFCEVAEYP